MKTICISDLDGTLLGSDSRISAYSRETLEGLMKRGLQFTYAIARAHPSSTRALQGLVPNLPAIIYNGVALCDGGTGKILSEVHFQEKEMETVRQFLTQNRIYPLVYSGLRETERVRWLQGEENEGIRHYLTTRKGDRRLTGALDEAELYQGKIFYFTCIGAREELMPVYERFCREDFCNCIFQQELYREEYFCELFPRSATKAEAVKKLRQITGAEKIIVFGDRLNDLPLFQASDECYAVANAVEELKQAADEILASNDEDGVARWLMEHAEKLIL
jgi:Cof subfamily protein (haloacid dehalogenase superfamily)